MTADAIVVENLSRDFGEVHALRDASLRVPTGHVLGLLGPNGAGKTTMVRILSTLLSPSRGSAQVLGLDVVRDAVALRHRIALAGQFAAVDALLTGRENLIMVGRLYRMSAAQAARRADELLQQFDLENAAGRIAKTYSGGMKRRLDLAVSLIGHPEVLFLDEPTTGLDPRSRRELWHVIRELVREGTTLLLCTQYLEEADQLAKSIALIDGGRVIAEGTADELKSRVGGEVLELRSHDVSELNKAAAALKSLSSGEPTVDAESGSLRIPIKEAGEVLVRAVRELDNAGVSVTDLAIHRPTLDDVFLALTGHTAEDQAVTHNGRKKSRRASGEESEVMA